MKLIKKCASLSYGRNALSAPSNLTLQSQVTQGKNMQDKRLNPVAPENAQGEVKKLFDMIQTKMNTVPNIFKGMGNSPAALKGYFALSDAAAQTSLSPQLREQIALAVAQANSCNYCLSAHCLIAKSTGLGDSAIQQARHGQSANQKDSAILAFAKKVVDKKGHVQGDDVAQLRTVGVSDQELVEIILVITVNMFTNYFNNVTGTEIDFPPAPQLS